VAAGKGKNFSLPPLIFPLGNHFSSNFEMPHKPFRVHSLLLLDVCQSRMVTHKQYTTTLDISFAESGDGGRGLRRHGRESVRQRQVEEGVWRTRMDPASKRKATRRGK